MIILSEEQRYELIDSELAGVRGTRLFLLPAILGVTSQKPIFSRCSVSIVDDGRRTRR
jgi:hypothetical protein